jgi:hypothetical protein
VIWVVLIGVFLSTAGGISAAGSGKGVRSKPPTPAHAGPDGVVAVR